MDKNERRELLRKKKLRARRKKYIRVYAARAFLALLILLAVSLAGFGFYSIGKAVVGGVKSIASGKESTTKDGSAGNGNASGAEAEGPGTAEGTADASGTEAIVKKEPVIQTVTITAVGDCTLGSNQLQGYENSWHEAYDTKGSDYFLKNVKSIFEEDDFTIANLEGVLTEETKGLADKKYLHKGKPKYVSVLTGASVEAVSLANNHNMDYGEKSQQDTKDVLDEAGIEWSLDDKLGYYTTEQGVVIGFISVNFLESRDKKLALVLENMETLKENANLVIVCAHWGKQDQYEVYDYQIDFAKQMIDAGADLIIGHHPHRMHGLASYKGVAIAYSLGNFCYGGSRKPKDMDCLIFQQTFTLVDGVRADTFDVKLIPATISSKTSTNNYQPKLATGDEYDRIIKKAKDMSKKLGDEKLFTQFQ